MGDGGTVKRGKISELTPDQHNANDGTERGGAMLEGSLRRYGAGRSILLDKNGRIIAGNKTAEKAADIGLDDVIIVPTDGKTLVAVQRMDLDLDIDETARMLAYADNRVGEVDLSWNTDVVLGDAMELDLSPLWSMDELELMREVEEKEDRIQEKVMLDQAIQLRPAREYAVIMCDDPAEFEELKAILDLRPVRRGGYSPGSPFDATGIERVVLFSRFKELISGAAEDANSDA